MALACVSCQEPFKLIFCEKIFLFLMKFKVLTNLSNVLSIFLIIIEFSSLPPHKNKKKPGDVNYDHTKPFFKMKNLYNNLCQTPSENVNNSVAIFLGFKLIFKICTIICGKI